MIRIAIVEDDKNTELLIRDYINKYALESERKIDITSFGDGDEIVENYKMEYDILLMDIQMQFMDGLTAARKIREQDPDVVIIFITNMAQYAIHGYEVNAFDYVLKPVSYFSFSEKLNRAVERMKKQDRQYLTIALDRGLKKIEISQIRYIESQGHKITFHTGSKEYITLSFTMKELEEKLENNHFYRCNKGYLVNLEYVEGIQDGCAVIADDRIMISRLKKTAFWEALTNYVGDTVN